MPKTVEVFEPGIAIPKGLGYVGIGKPDDKIAFPHLDSCCGVVGLFNDGSMIGGHFGAQWPGLKEVDYAFCGNRIFTLMEANRQRLKLELTEIRAFISVFPRESGKWAQAVTVMTRQWQALTLLEIDTSNCAKGADVTIDAAKGVTVVDCKSNYSITYPIPADMDVKSEVFPLQT